MRIPTFRIVLLAIAVLGGLVAVSIALPARAESTAVFVPVALAPVQRDTAIELVALTLDAEITESNGHTIISGNSTFKLHNTDKLNDVSQSVGFPAWAGDLYAFSPSQLSVFNASLEGKKVTLSTGKSDLKIQSSIRAVDWYSFALTLAADDKKTVKFDFVQDLGEGSFPRFTFGLLPATAWKGSVGSARLTIRFPRATTLEQFVAYDPANPEFDGSNLTWSFTSHEPPSNPTLTLLRPSTYSDLIARRRAVQQNPSDADAHSTLGTLLKQIAMLDSPKADSYYSQAIAEFETAVRLDPMQRSARQALAALYEARAGPAAGPRQPGYVSLAATQWETLAPTDAAARKQLAEDYFYLGVDAQTRGAYADASAYWDKANTLMPGGAGPLFTVERLTAQRRTMNIAWARALLDKEDYASAIAPARAALGDSFMSTVTPPTFYVSRANVVTADNSRIMTFRLVSFSTGTAELEDSVRTALGSVSTARANAQVSDDGADTIVTVTVPFDSDALLQSRLSAVAGTLPNLPEWSFIRAVANPSALSWDAPGGLITNSFHYREQVDLAEGCSSVQGQMAKISSNLVALDNAASTDQEAQLKRALLKTAQDGWQRVLTQGRATYRAGSGEMSVEPCTAKTLERSEAPLRIEFLAILAVVVGMLSLVVLVLMWFGLRRSRQPMPGSPRRS